MQDGLFGIDVSKGIHQVEYEHEDEHVKTSYKKRVNKKVLSEDLSVANEMTQSVDNSIQVNTSLATKKKSQSVRETDFHFDESASNFKELQ